MLNRALQGATAAAAEKLYIEDVMSVYLYTGNGSTQTITNGIDLAGEGGLVWIKQRSLANTHRLFDTLRGAEIALSSAATSANTTRTGSLTAFSSDGFNLGDDSTTNGNNETHASWTFRKAAKFFDVVTYTGNGTARSIAHNLGSVPGCVIVKRLNFSTNWRVQHRSLDTAAGKDLVLNSTSAVVTNGDTWNSTPADATSFTVGTDGDTNASGGTYVAYLFAHDAGGFGDAGTDNVVSCGSYTGNGSTSGPTVTLGWEPQWLLVKNATSAGNNWVLIDNMRGFSVTGNQWLYPNDSAAEGTTGLPVAPFATGFQPRNSGTFVNESGSTYIYIAIRRGPMKTPEDATTVYSAQTYTGNGTNPRILSSIGFPPDLVHYKMRNNSISDGNGMATRLLGTGFALVTNSTGAEAFYNTVSGFGSDSLTVTSSTEINGVSDYTYVANSFRRAPGFFDVVAYTGNGTFGAKNHSLGVAPELVIIKARSGSSIWAVYRPSEWGSLNTTDAFGSYTATLTSSTFSAFLDTNGTAYIAYLFATCPGISKVGSYTGTGTTLSIDCGFTAGARFVLIKRTDSTGDWFVWDTARGIVSGNDSYLLLNSTATEVTNTDYIDPLSSGFQISSTAPAAINASGGSFIFLAIA